MHAGSREDARGIMRALGATTFSMVQTYSDVGVDARARTAIIKYADVMRTKQPSPLGEVGADLKLQLTHAQLGQAPSLDLKNMIYSIS